MLRLVAAFTALMTAERMPLEDDIKGDHSQMRDRLKIW